LDLSSGRRWRSAAINCRALARLIVVLRETSGMVFGFWEIVGVEEIEIEVSD